MTIAAQRWCTCPMDAHVLATYASHVYPEWVELPGCACGQLHAIPALCYTEWQECLTGRHRIAMCVHMIKFLAAGESHYACGEMPV